MPYPQRLVEAGDDFTARLAASARESTAVKAAWTERQKAKAAKDAVTPTLESKLPPELPREEEDKDSFDALAGKRGRDPEGDPTRAKLASTGLQTDGSKRLNTVQAMRKRSLRIPKICLCGEYHPPRKANTTRLVQGSQAGARAGTSEYSRRSFAETRDLNYVQASGRASVSGVVPPLESGITVDPSRYANCATCQGAKVPKGQRAAYRRALERQALSDAAANEADDDEDTTSYLKTTPTPVPETAASDGTTKSIERPNAEVEDPAGTKFLMSGGLGRRSVDNTNSSVSRAQDESTARAQSHRLTSITTPTSTANSAATQQNEEVSPSLAVIKFEDRAIKPAETSTQPVPTNTKQRPEDASLPKLSPGRREIVDLTQEDDDEIQIVSERTTKLNPSPRISLKREATAAFGDQEEKDLDLDLEEQKRQLHKEEIELKWQIRQEQLEWKWFTSSPQCRLTLCRSARPWLHLQGLPLHCIPDCDQQATAYCHMLQTVCFEPSRPLYSEIHCRSLSSFATPRQTTIFESPDRGGCLYTTYRSLFPHTP